MYMLEEKLKEQKFRHRHNFIYLSFLPPCLSPNIWVMIYSLLASISSTVKMRLEKVKSKAKIKKNCEIKLYSEQGRKWEGMFQVKDCETLNYKFQRTMYAYIAYSVTECISES